MPCSGTRFVPHWYSTSLHGPIPKGKYHYKEQHQSLKAPQILINALMNKLDLGGMEIEIPDIEVKIKELEEEIGKIMNTDPYQYRYQLMI